MNIKVLIVLADGGFRVHIIALYPPARAWLKAYSTKLNCVAELKSVALITHSELTEAVETDFATTDGMLIFQASAEPAFLRAIGFVEQKRMFIN